MLMHESDCESLKRLIAEATIARAGRIVHERDTWDIELTCCTGCSTTHYGEWVEFDAISHAPACPLERRTLARACLAALGMPPKAFLALDEDASQGRVELGGRESKSSMENERVALSANERVALSVNERVALSVNERVAFEGWARSAFAEFERGELNPLSPDHAFARHSADHPNAGEYVDPAIETAWYAWKGRAGVTA